MPSKGYYAQEVDMKVSPISRYADPRYPARDILDDHPELLRRLPNRWRQSAVIGTAVAAACGLVAAGWQAARAEGEPEAKPAPVFLHGEGHGSFGCVAVNPPLFLSEDEAREVIMQELQRPPYPKLKMTADGRTLADFPVPETSDQAWHDEKLKLGTKKQDLALDGWDAKHNIGYEYVSEADFKAWTKRGGMMSTVSVFDMANTAKRLQASIAAVKPEGTIAVFYDPMIGYQDAQRDEKDGNRDWQQRQDDARMIARYVLRLQVRDFIAWLKAEGAI